MGLRSAVNRMEKLLGSLRSREEKPGADLDPSKLSDEELVEVQGILRLGHGLARETPLQGAEREARDTAHPRSYTVPRRETRDDEREMQRRDFDPDRLSEEDRTQLENLLQKMSVEG